LTVGLGYIIPGPATGPEIAGTGATAASAPAADSEIANSIDSATRDIGTSFFNE
jgi:hypothetical protein